MKIMDLKQNKIEEWFGRGTIMAKKILQEFGIDAETTPSESYITKLYNEVLKDLKEKGYIIGYDSVLDEMKHQSIPAATLKDKTILLNSDYPEQAQFEALFHEYIHLRDNTLPSIEDNLGDSEKLIEIDNIVDITAYIFIMPPEQLKKNLKAYNYRINRILQVYKDFEKCTILQWITLNSLFECHFAWIMYVNEIKYKNVYDACSYDQKNDPKKFDIDEVLATKSSAAAKAVREKRGANNQLSFLKRKGYRCYAYYESGLKGKICNVKLENITTFNFDRLLVIGWEISVFEKWKKITPNSGKTTMYSIIFKFSNRQLRF
jgi:phosphatidylglycerophosphatase A